jgi:hypothetical protein
MVVPFITQYKRMVRDTAATTMRAPSCAPLTESAVGLQLCCGLDNRAYLCVVYKGVFTMERNLGTRLWWVSYQHMKTEYENMRQGVRRPLPTLSSRDSAVVMTPMISVRMM